MNSENDEPLLDHALSPMKSGPATTRQKRWRQIDRLFVEALALPEAHRNAFLDKACGLDADLRDHVEQLLLDDGALAEFLEAPYAPNDREAVAPSAKFLGTYRLLGRLGSGGMGTVYLAEQCQPVERKVALKVVRADMDSEQILARFEGERQAMALMDHANVARVYDAGCTPEGRSYFAMEYVPGLDITTHCDRLGLNFRERIHLFLQVCDGVQHSHQKGLIHRDLKPSNLLVRVSIGEPATVKIIDFGVAKSLQRKLTSHAAQTELGTFVGTPTYSSPEQIWGRFIDTDIRSDVYSLGVVLYELLVGAPPYRDHEFRQMAPIEMARKLLDQDPPTAATRFRELEDTHAVAAQRSMPVVRIQKSLRGDLSWILTKCLERHPEERYPSVLELRKDLERWLANRPLEARPTTGLYRLKKWGRRHRMALVMVCLCALALLITTSTAILEFLRAEKAAESAQLAALEADMAANFQVEQLQAIDPAVMGARLRSLMQEELLQHLAAQQTSDPTTIEAQTAPFQAWLEDVPFTDLSLSLLDRSIFDRSQTVIATQYNELPLLQARLWQSLADTLRELGRLGDAVEPQERALHQRREELGPDHRLTLESLRNRGQLRLGLHQLEAAERDLEEALERVREVLGDSHPDTLRTLLILSELRYYQQDYEKGGALALESMRGMRQTLGDKHPETLGAISSLAVFLVDQGRLAEAEPLHREAMEGRREVFGNDHRETLQSINNVALLLLRMGRPQEAEAHLREALAGKRRVLGNDHPKTFRANTNLGLFLQRQGRLDEAETFFREALEISRRTYGRSHRNSLVAASILGNLLQDQGQYAEAVASYLQTLQGMRRVLGEDDVETLHAQSNLGNALRKWGRLDESLAISRELLRTGRRARPDHYLLGSWSTDHARTLSAMGRFDEAETILEEALELLSKNGGVPPRYLESCLQEFVALYEARHALQPGRAYDQEAARWRDRLDRLQQANSSIPMGTS